MDQQRRVLIAVGISVGLSLAYSQFFIKPKLEAQAAAEAAALSDGGVAAVVTSDAGVAVSPSMGAAAPAEAVPVEAKTIAVRRPAMALTFSSTGAGLVDAILQGPRERENRQLTVVEGWRKLFGATFEPGPQVDLANPAPFGPPQLGTSIRGEKGFDARAVYEVREEAVDHIVFVGTQGPWQVTKTMRWSGDATGPSAYTLDVDVEVKNVSASNATGELAMLTTRAIQPDAEQAGSFLGGIGNQASVLCRHDDKVMRELPKDDFETKKESASIGFVGIDQQYFVAALWPRNGALPGRCEVNATQAQRSADLVLPLELEPGQAVTHQFGAFLGPKDSELLAALDSKMAGVNPMLEKTIDFGTWFAVLCKPLLFLLRLFHGFTGNWGFAIILLTVLVKLVLLPLTHRAMVSAEKMKKFQPRIEELKKKYANDQEKQNAEMMKLYSEGGFNPLGGCLPLLAQMPIWAALFTTLRTSYELYGEPFIGPVWTDLTFKDPSYILPLALGITMLVTQRFQPQMGDQSQAFLMNWVMPIVFTAMMMNYPAGLALYIFTNNLLSIAQQFALRRYLAGKGGSSPSNGMKPSGAAS